MDNAFLNCPYCGKTVMKGAMRCVACGKILQTPEEQMAKIEKLQAKQKFNVKGLLKGTVTILVLGLLCYYFSERIIVMIKSIFHFINT